VDWPFSEGGITGSGEGEGNLAVPMSRIIADAGINGWVRAFLNLHST